MIHAVCYPISFEAAANLDPQERAHEIIALCQKIDALEDQGRPDLAEPFYATLQNLTCAHGTCGHYTCTQGYDLWEWETSRRLNGEDV